MRGPSRYTFELHTLRKCIQQVPLPSNRSALYTSFHLLFISFMYSYLSSSCTHYSTAPRSGSTPIEGKNTALASPFHVASQSAPLSSIRHVPAKNKPAKSFPAPLPPFSPPPGSKDGTAASSTCFATPCRKSQQPSRHVFHTDSNPRPAILVPKAAPSSSRRPADSEQHSRSSRGWKPAGRRQWRQSSRQPRDRKREIRGREEQNE